MRMFFEYRLTTWETRAQIIDAWPEDEQVRFWADLCFVSDIDVERVWRGCKAEELGLRKLPRPPGMEEPRARAAEQVGELFQLFAGVFGADENVAQKGKGEPADEHGIPYHLRNYNAIRAEWDAGKKGPFFLKGKGQHQAGDWDLPRKGNVQGDEEQLPPRRKGVGKLQNRPMKGDGKNREGGLDADEAPPRAAEVPRGANEGGWANGIADDGLNAVPPRPHQNLPPGVELERAPWAAQQEFFQRRWNHEVAEHGNFNRKAQRGVNVPQKGKGDEEQLPPHRKGVGKMENRPMKGAAGNLEVGLDAGGAPPRAAVAPPGGNKGGVWAKGIAEILVRDGWGREDQRPVPAAIGNGQAAGALVAGVVVHVQPPGGVAA